MRARRLEMINGGVIINLQKPIMSMRIYAFDIFSQIAKSPHAVLPGALALTALYPIIKRRHQAEIRLLPAENALTEKK